MSHEKSLLEFESGFPIAAGNEGEGAIVAVELPKATVATTLHVGDQATSEEAYRAIHSWMAFNGESAAGAPWEAHLSEPTVDATNGGGAKSVDATRVKTQIYLPIR